MSSAQGFTAVSFVEDAQASFEKYADVGGKCKIRFVMVIVIVIIISSVLSFHYLW